MLRRIRWNGGILTGFTLMELLVVISIMTILMGMLLPSLSGARESARIVYCTNNVRQLMMANSQYSDENNETWPGRSSNRYDDFENTLTSWVPSGHQGSDLFDLRKGSLFPLLKETKVFYCPSDPAKLDNRTCYSINANLYAPGVSSPCPADPNQPPPRPCCPSAQGQAAGSVNASNPEDRSYIRYPKPARFNQAADRLITFVDTGFRCSATFDPVSPSRFSGDELNWNNHRNKTSIGFFDSHVSQIRNGEPCTRDYLNPSWFPDENNLEVVD